jgi:hypothetical protein
MKSIGIQRSSSIELVDATVVDGSIVPSQCPGDLGRSCNACPHAWTAGTVTVSKRNKKAMPFPLMVCRWHDERPDGQASAPGAPG